MNEISYNLCGVWPGLGDSGKTLHRNFLNAKRIKPSSQDTKWMGLVWTAGWRPAEIWADAGSWLPAEGELRSATRNPGHQLNPPRGGGMRALWQCRQPVYAGNAAVETAATGIVFALFNRCGVSWKLSPNNIDQITADVRWGKAGSLIIPWRPGPVPDKKLAEKACLQSISEGALLHRAYYSRALPPLRLASDPAKIGRGQKPWKDIQLMGRQLAGRTSACTGTEVSSNVQTSRFFVSVVNLPGSGTHWTIYSATPMFPYALAVENYQYGLFLSVADKVIKAWVAPAQHIRVVWIFMRSAAELGR
ncbi:hypothetical protein B0H19DRAFT_1279469 [Mycena capillaripes]|nr:hypothetical protein B0H19DRAFT_1279469 [Mycena capillaripes]